MPRTSQHADGVCFFADGFRFRVLPCDVLAGAVGAFGFDKGATTVLAAATAAGSRIRAVWHPLPPAITPP